MLRTYPMASTTFVGIALRDLEIDGLRIPAGTKGIGLPTATLQDGSTFRDPGTFDPDRLGDEVLRALPENAFIPMGGGPRDGHRCGGEELVKMTMPAFISWFARNYDWTFPAQDISVGPGSVGPLPRGGLRMHIRKRARGGAERPVTPRAGHGRICTDW